MRYLIRIGMVKSETYLSPPRVQAKKVRTLHLKIDPKEIEEKIEKIGRPGSARDRRKKILTLLSAHPEGLELSLITMTVDANHSDYQKLEEE